MLNRLYLPFVFVIALLVACNSQRREVDIADVAQQVSFFNLQKDLDAADTTRLNEEHQQLYQRYGSFWRAYCEDILRLGAARSEQSVLLWKDFSSDPMIEELEKAISEIHEDRLPLYETEIDNAFRRYHVLFPEKSLPDIVFMNSGFNFGVWPTGEHLGIGLDFFIGAEHPLVTPLDPNLFPNYQKAKMRPDLLVPDALRGWLLVSHQQAHYNDENLIQTVLYYGKMMYLLDLMLPAMEDYRLIDYTAEEFAWCRENERNLWISFSDQEVLYERRKFEINRWVSDAPFTRAVDLPQETPGRVGIWIGWQIVSDYMQRNPDVSPAEMLELTNPITFLNAYRPD